jgi:hypothetical protein
MTNPAIWPAWAGFGLGVLNLGYTVVDRYLRVPMDHRIGSDLPELRRNINRAIFMAGQASYAVTDGVGLDDELRGRLEEVRDALSVAAVEGSDVDLIALLGLALHDIDRALDKSKAKRWDAVEDSLEEASARLYELSTRKVWRWKA